MADHVVVPTTATGATVAAENIGSTVFQLVKLVDGAASQTSPVVATSGTPAAGTVGLVVAVKPGVSVVAQVSGTVSVSSMPAVSGTVTVLGSVSVSGQAQVSGTVSVSGTPTVAVPVVSTVLGTVLVSLAAAISGTVTVNNGASVTIQQGASVGVAVSITGTTAGANLALQGSTGQLAASVFGLAVRVADSAAVSGTVTVNNGVSVTIQQGASVSAVVSGTVTVAGSVSLSGTGIVSVVPGLSVVVSGTVSVSHGVSVAFSTNIITTAAPAAGATGAIVWVGNPGGPATTTAPPSISAGGTPVWIAGGQGTTVNPVFVTGTVTADVGTTVVSGTLTVQNINVTTTQAAVTGLVVWLAPTQTLNVAVGGSTAIATTTQAAVTGAISWLAPTQTIAMVSTVGTISTILGTQVVSVVPGLSVSAVVSGTVSALLAQTTTTQAAVTGLVVWLAPTQTLSVNVGASTAIATTTQAAVTGAVVWLAPTQTANVTVVTQLGTQVVSVVPGLSVSAVVSGTVSVLNVVPVTTAASVSVTGIPVWLNPTQQVAVSGLVGHSVTGSVNIVSTAVVAGTVSALLAQTTTTQAAVTGIVVWLAPTQTLSINVATTAVATTTQAAVTGAVVWLAPTQTANVTVVTQLGTQVVSVVPGLSVSAVVSGTVSVLNVVPVTTAASVSVTGLPVWLNPTQQVAVSGLVGHSVTGSVNIVSTAVVAGTVSALLAQTTTTQAAVTGIVVWLAPTQTLSINVATTAVATTTQAAATGAVVWLAPTQTANVTVVTQLGTQVVSVVPGLSVSAVVSGTVSVLNVVPVTTAASVSVTGVPVWLNPTQSVNVGTVTTILGTQVVSVVPGLSVSAVVSGTVTVGNILVTTTGVTTGTAQAVWIMNPTTVTVTIAGTTTGTVSILNVVPVVTQASVSVTGLPVWWNPTATVAVSGAISGVTTQTAVTGAGIWLAPTQTIAVMSTIVTILGTQIVSVVPGLSVSAVASGTVSISNTVNVSQQGLPAQTAFAVNFTCAALVSAAPAVDASGQIYLNHTTSSFASNFTVPAGKTFRINQLMVYGNQVTAATIFQAIFQLQVSTAAFTTTGSPLLQGIICITTTQGTPNIMMLQGLELDLPAAATVALYCSVSPAVKTAGISIGANLAGYLY